MRRKSSGAVPVVLLTLLGADTVQWLTFAANMILPDLFRGCALVFEASAMPRSRRVSTESAEYDAVVVCVEISFAVQFRCGGAPRSSQVRSQTRQSTKVTCGLLDINELQAGWLREPLDSFKLSTFVPNYVARTL